MEEDEDVVAIAFNCASIASLPPSTHTHKHTLRDNSQFLHS